MSDHSEAFSARSTGRSLIHNDLAARRVLFETRLGGTPIRVL